MRRILLTLAKLLAVIAAAFLLCGLSLIHI